MSEFDRLSDSGSIPQMDLDTELPWERAARTALAVDADFDAAGSGSDPHFSALNRNSASDRTLWV